MFTLQTSATTALSSSPSPSPSASASASSQQRIALVTGANKGIGKEIARLLGKDPTITTIMACRSLERGKAAAQELIKGGCTDLHCIELDLTKPENFDTTVHDYIATRFGGRLDILVNNAAICFNDPTLYGKVSHTPFAQQARITIETNFVGTWKLIQALTPLLNKSESESESNDYPRIINIASSAGRLGILKSQDMVDQVTSERLTMQELEQLMGDFVEAIEESGGSDTATSQRAWPTTCYGMSKVGIIAMAKVLARERPTWQCNSVDPGYCATDQNQMQGFRTSARGAVTPYLLATIEGEENHTGLHWMDEKTIAW